MRVRFEPINLDKLFEFCVNEIHIFSQSHQSETFYAFSIDAALLCLNSEEKFEKSLAYYRKKWDEEHREIRSWEELTQSDQEQIDRLVLYYKLDKSKKTECLAFLNELRSKERSKGNPYFDPEEIRSLRFNTGDWAYQGFATMSKDVGFDERLYWEEHYYLEEHKQKTSRYGRAMDRLVARLISARAFDCLNLSPTFAANRVEHTY